MKCSWDCLTITGDDANTSISSARDWGKASNILHSRAMSSFPSILFSSHASTVEAITQPPAMDSTTVAEEAEHFFLLWLVFQSCFRAVERRRQKVLRKKKRKSNILLVWPCTMCPHYSTFGRALNIRMLVKWYVARLEECVTFFSCVCVGTVCQHLIELHCVAVLSFTWRACVQNLPVRVAEQHCTLTWLCSGGSSLQIMLCDSEREKARWGAKWSRTDKLVQDL